MKKQHIRLTAALLLMVLLLGLLPVAQAAESVSASGNSIDLSLDGKAVKIGAYNIAGSNYIKLRDIAQLLKGTDKEFAVAWDGASQSISLNSWEEYTPVGGELAPVAPGVQTARPSAASVLWYGTPVPLTAYTINGNNFFRLRDLSAVLNFRVTWEGSSGTVIVDTTHGYQAADGGPGATSDGELLALASVAGNGMKNMIYGFEAGACFGQEWEDCVEYNGTSYCRVPGLNSMKDLEDAWYQDFSRRYPIEKNAGSSYKEMYLERNGALYTRNQGIGDDMTDVIVDKMVSRSGDEAVFQGQLVDAIDGGSYGTMEFSLVYENGTWLYGYYKEL